MRFLPFPDGGTSCDVVCIGCYMLMFNRCASKHARCCRNHLKQVRQKLIPPRLPAPSAHAQVHVLSQLNVEGKFRGKVGPTAKAYLTFEVCAMGKIMEPTFINSPLPCLASEALVTLLSWQTCFHGRTFQGHPVESNCGENEASGTLAVEDRLHANKAPFSPFVKDEHDGEHDGLRQTNKTKSNHAAINPKVCHWERNTCARTRTHTHRHDTCDAFKCLHNKYLKNKPNMVSSKP